MAGVLFAAWAPLPCRGCCACGAAVLHSCSPSELTFPFNPKPNLTFHIGRLSASLSLCPCNAALQLLMVMASADLQLF